MAELISLRMRLFLSMLITLARVGLQNLRSASMIVKTGPRVDGPILYQGEIVAGVVFF
jgi:hypothetical protein